MVVIYRKSKIVAGVLSRGTTFMVGRGLAFIVKNGIYERLVNALVGL